MKNRILVTGATGAQGGACARQLLAAGFPVRILARQPQSAPALALADAGAEVVQGDFDDPATVAAAMRDVFGVFSVQLPAMGNTDSERRHCATLVQAALDAGVQQFVHTSVAQAGKHTTFPRWESGCWSTRYWTDKWDAEETVRGAGFPHWTVLKPAFMMDNFVDPKARYMFPQLHKGVLLSALLPDTRMDLVAASDVGAFACAAFAQPDRFDRQNIALAAESLTMGEVAAALSQAGGQSVVASSVSSADAIAAGMNPNWVRSQEWSNEVGYQVDIAALASYGIEMTTFARWAQQHAGAGRLDK